MPKEMQPGLDPLIGAMFEQMSKDAAFTTNALMDGYERTIRDLSQALVKLYDVVKDDPNLTVRMSYAADYAAGGYIDQAERVISNGYYADRTYAERFSSKDMDSY